MTKNDSVAIIEVAYTYYENDSELRSQRVFEVPYNSRMTNGDISNLSVEKMIKAFWIKNRTPHLKFGAIEWMERHQ